MRLSCISVSGLVLLTTLVAMPASAASPSPESTPQTVVRTPTHRSVLAKPRVVRPARIGLATVGMTVEEAMATGQFRADVANPPCDPIALQPTKPYKNQYAVLVADDTIVEMNAYGGDMATATGSRIYSTYKRVERDYQQALSTPRETGFGQWGVFVHTGAKGPDRKWIGFLFGDALVDDGPLGANDVVTLIGVTQGKRPPLILDGC